MLYFFQKKRPDYLRYIKIEQVGYDMNPLLIASCIISLGNILADENSEGFVRGL